MADTFGLTFNPAATTSGGSGENRPTNAAQTPVQDAIRTLNLKVPRVVGAAPINTSLLTGAGSDGIQSMGGPTMAAPGGPQGAPAFDLETFLRKLFGMGQQPYPDLTGRGTTLNGPAPIGPAGMPGPMAPPSPRFYPGVGGSPSGTGDAMPDPTPNGPGPTTLNMPTMPQAGGGTFAPGAPSMGKNQQDYLTSGLFD